MKEEDQMYFCKNCGEPYMTDEAIMCVKCGVAKGQGNNYCHNCGKPLAPDATVCLNCGVANKQAPAAGQIQTGSRTVSYFPGILRYT